MFDQTENPTTGQPGVGARPAVSAIAVADEAWPWQDAALGESTDAAAGDGAGSDGAESAGSEGADAGAAGRGRHEAQSLDGDDLSIFQSYWDEFPSQTD